MREEYFPLYQLLKEDPRYPLEAYDFIRESLEYAQEVLNLGEETHPEPSLALEVEPESLPPERHLSGQQLCEAIRLYAIDQFGYLAKAVLNSWGMSSTSDFGEVVYNLISIGWMRKSPHDRRDHFDEVFEFDKAFLEDFRIETSEC